MIANREEVVTCVKADRGNSGEEIGRAMERHYEVLVSHQIS